MRVSKYSEIRDSIGTGDLILYSGTSPVAKLIQWRSKSPWNHAALGLDLTEYELRKCVVESVAQGPDISYISAEIEGYSGRIAWAPLRNNFADDETRHAIGRYLFNAEAENAQYDYATLLKNIIGLVSSDARRYICSGLAFFACAIGGGLPVQPQWIKNGNSGEYYIPRPGDLMSLNWWDEIHYLT